VQQAAHSFIFAEGMRRSSFIQGGFFKSSFQAKPYLPTLPTLRFSDFLKTSRCKNTTSTRALRHRMALVVHYFYIQKIDNVLFVSCIDFFIFDIVLI